MRSIGWRALAALVVTAVCVGPRPAAAVDWSPDTTRLLGDPAFLPLAGQVFGSFTYSHSNPSYDYVSSLSPLLGPPTVNSWSRIGNAYAPAVSYGITDDVTLGVSLQWSDVNGQDRYDLYSLKNVGGAGFPVFTRVLTQATSAVYSSGPSNPDFQLAWRAIDQRSAPLNLDLTAGYAPDIYTAQEPAYGTNGTQALGGQRFTLQASVSRETRFLTALAYAAFGYDGRRDLLEPGGYDVTRISPHPDFSAGLQAEARPVSFAALNFGLNFQQSTTFHQEDISSATPERSIATVRPGLDISPYVGVVVPFLRRHAAVELLYQHDFIGDELVDEPYGYSNRYYNQGENLFAARLLFAFGVL